MVLGDGQILFVLDLAGSLPARLVFHKLGDRQQGGLAADEFDVRSRTPLG